jgi:hypothetical protein
MKHCLLRGDRSIVLQRMLLLIGALVCIAPLQVAAATTSHYMYCWAHVQQAKARYLTDIFETTGNPADVVSAWQQYLEAQHIDSGGQQNCDAGVRLADVKAMRDLHPGMADAIGAHVVAANWTYAPGAVPESDPGLLYQYCQSGTSVAGTTYVSDVFGVALPKMVANAPDIAGAFFQYVSGKYGNPPGLGAGRPSGPGDRWCEFGSNISEAERSKKAWVDKLRSQSQKIVETGWHFDATAQPVAATPPATALPVAAIASKPGAVYGFCYAQTADDKKMYFSAVFEMPMEDVRAGSRVITAEFNKALVQRYGSPGGPSDARSGGCAPNWNLSATAVEEKRQLVFAAARERRTQIFDSGWTFVRTAQTPPPGPPLGR